MTKLTLGKAPFSYTAETVDIDCIEEYAMDFEWVQLPDHWRTLTWWEITDVDGGCLDGHVALDYNEGCAYLEFDSVVTRIQGLPKAWSVERALTAVAEGNYCADHPAHFEV